uniref:hypothetical protein n=1 Tax=Bifidobacterium adolescentis TaxID=1680 RepID=UPI003FF09A38
MATRRRLTNRFKDEYAKASKKEKKLILDRLVEVGMGRSPPEGCQGNRRGRPARAAWNAGANPVPVFCFDVC